MREANGANICKCGILVEDNLPCPKCEPMQYIKAGGSMEKTEFYKAQELMNDIVDLEKYLEKIKNNYSMSVNLRNPNIRELLLEAFSKMKEVKEKELEKL